MYFVKTPKWLKGVFRNYVWSINSKEKAIYLTFDDGPHPQATPFVLEQLEKFGAKASFFCLGKNVIQYPTIYQDILAKGHSIGNHTHNHLNGWKTDTDIYLSNIEEARQYISSSLFRPPYGRIKRQQGRRLRKNGFKIIMWDVLSGDFDVNISKERCKKNVIEKAQSGSIVVFHDSAKAFGHLSYTLPDVLTYFSKRGFVFKGILNQDASK